jgi:hypothetical protein
LKDHLAAPQQKMNKEETMKRVENLCNYNLIKRKQHQMVCKLILEFRRFTILANTYQNKKEKIGGLSMIIILIPV